MEKPERADRADYVKCEKNIKISLPEKERKILHMRIFEALDYREISRRTGISALSLRVMVSNARRRLKTL